MKKLFCFITLLICLSGLLLIPGGWVFAEGESAGEPVNEDELFSGSETIVSEDQVVTNTVDDELKEKHIGFSGQIHTNTAYANYSPEFGWAPPMGKIELVNQIGADLFVDIRLKKGVKGFLSLGVDYVPFGLDPSQSELLNIGIKEFFIDANWKNQAYFRTGKQVLKWGQGYFWNPTDLININKKDFADMNAVRAGTFGTKIQFPSGVKQNVYFFVGMDKVQKLNDLSLAGKYEFLLGITEMSVSAWAKEGSQPIYGYDFSGRLGSFDLRGELSLRDGAGIQILDYDTLALKPVSESGELITQACLGFTKGFNVGDDKERISVTGEFYYNQAGYDQNIIQRIEDEPHADSSDPLDPQTREKAQTIYQSNQPYTNSKYYLAFFSSLRKFIVTDMSLNLNGMMNLVDHSGTVSAGISYVPSMGDISVDFGVTGNFGDPYTEALMTGNLWSMNLGTRIVF